MGAVREGGGEADRPDRGVRATSQHDYYLVDLPVKVEGQRYRVMRWDGRWRVTGGLIDSEYERFELLSVSPSELKEKAADGPYLLIRDGKLRRG